MRAHTCRNHFYENSFGEFAETGLNKHVQIDTSKIQENGITVRLVKRPISY